MGGVGEGGGEVISRRMAALRVLIISDNPLARMGIQSLVKEMPGVAEAGSGTIPDAPSLAAQLHPDAVLLHVGVGDAEDVESIARLAAAQPGLPLVALSDQTSGLAQALSAGASALLPAGVDAETLSAALVASTNDLVTFGRADLPAFLPTEEGIPSSAQAPVESLTARELEVLQWMARGLTNRQIAQRLRISEHTIKFHVTAVLGKLGARTRAEAVARGVSLGWIMV